MQTGTGVVLASPIVAVVVCLNESVSVIEKRTNCPLADEQGGWGDKSRDPVEVVMCCAQYALPHAIFPVASGAHSAAVIVPEYGAHPPDDFQYT